MHTILITGSDTDIGKTHVAAAVGRLLWRPGLRVQFVKPVETGRPPNEPGDAEEAARASGIDGATAFTLARFSLPLAPLAAARAHTLTGAPAVDFSIHSLLAECDTLPPADLRIVEGAGGIAVPLDADGSDWRDFARAVQADRIILVVPDRLGAINQARLIMAYSHNDDIPAGIWLNECRPQPDAIRESNRSGLARLPLWATQRFNAPLPEEPELTRGYLTATATAT